MRYRALYYRAAFFLFCIAPTVYTVGWLVERQVTKVTAASADPRFRPSVEREFSRILGVAVSLGGVEQHAKITRLTKVELRDPETEELLATADTVEMYYADGGVLAIEPAGVTVQAGQLWRLSEVLHVNVLREMPATLSVEAGCPSVHLVGGAREESLSEVNLSIGHRPEGRFAKLTFKPAWDLHRPPLTLEVARKVSDSGRRSALSFATGEKPLPATWFDFCLPAFGELGDTCSVSGALSAEETDYGWQSEFRGTLHGVDLNQMVASRLRKYPLGTANVSIDQARWHGEKLVEANGLIEAGNVQLSWATLLEVAPVLNLNDQQGLLHLDALRKDLIVSQGQLFCRFSVRSDGLVMVGHQGSVVWEGQKPLFSPPANPLPWSKPLLLLCREIGMPPLDSIPAGFDQEPPGGVRLNRD